MVGIANVSWPSRVRIVITVYSQSFVWGNLSRPRSTGRVSAILDDAPGCPHWSRRGQVACPPRRRQFHGLQFTRAGNRRRPRLCPRPAPERQQQRDPNSGRPGHQLRLPVKVHNELHGREENEISEEKRPERRPST
jgi:hypothetical protein